MFVSVIIPTYKDMQALELILDAMKLQTYKNFEVIVAEDDASEEVKFFLKNYNSDYEIKHFSHGDEGWRKAKAVNGAVNLSVGEYLVFFDGDCLPYSTFVESHVVLSEEKRVLCGRRVNTGDQLSQQLREKKISVTQIEQSFFSFWSKFKKDRSRHVEQGLYLFPKTLFYRSVIRYLDKKSRLVGCNFSLHKNDFLAINGFDESYPSGDVADDVDVEWRLNAIGVKNKSCKYAANLIHLNHTRQDRKEAHKRNSEIMMQRQALNEFFCKEGIQKESDEV
ncbi:MAG: glycosyltransferase [Sulfurimonas sp.]|jgi:cellulose synthase/poly-beta-1,6-N-acetylglucosamine synthase-like glycosyltransferase